MAGPESLAFFDYELPADRIAQIPAEPRDSARLLIDRGPGAAPDDARIPALLDELGPGDVVVVNDTRVLPARLSLHKPTGGAVEVLLLEPVGAVDASGASEWFALVKPGKRVKGGQILEADGRPVVEVVAVAEDGRRHVRLLDPAIMNSIGETPLPPYITQPLDDAERYQTVYADRPGSVAAPTAGLHLTDELIAEIQRRGVGFERVELRVGLGTFRPVEAEAIADHRMHAETYRVEADAWERIQAAERVVAVGTTSVRTLESVAATGRLEGSTELFIRRGFDWQVVDLLLTNFHVPKSSLLVMIDAFCGDDRWRGLYAHAIDHDYRFLSLGDAMLLRRGNG